jgi:Cu/Ag efflux pump CusA
LSEKVQEISALLSQVPGLVDVQAELPSEEPEVHIMVNLANAEKYQVKPGEVRRQASALISGIQVGNLYQDQKVFDVVVWGDPAIRNSLTNLENLLIDTPSGQVPLKEVAEVTVAPAPTVIRRDKVARFMDVTANIDSGSLASVSAAIEEKLKGVIFPLEHHAELLKESAVRADARQRTIYFVIAALLGIFLLLQAASQKWSMAALTFITLPMALAGGTVAALLGGGVLTLSALFGFLGSQGAGERFGPILTTAITTILALLPFLLLGNIAGHEVVRPLAVVMIGGLVTATLYNLLVVPALYLHYGQVTETEFVDALHKVREPGLQAAD